ncbi:MAG: dihydroxyacetone kinase subunit DhaK [Acidobacteriaceae bacterium]|nr:dihydroxyacetone kinase subunit DhaK [Acidobacteriaceae bacterium]
MKKLINSAECVVAEMLDGLVTLYPGLARVANYNVLARSDAEQACEIQVALISGGGSGHEPAHAGYVGAGMLTAAVAGEVFTSPSSASVLAAIRAVTGQPGALLIVKNYTGDRLNFGLAAEVARAEGRLIETVTVSDDVALAGSQDHAGRRGIAGTVFIHKIAGAAAAEGKDLPQVAAIAQAAAENVGTMGVSLSAGTSPSVGKPSFELGDEVELGLGIHGEPGVRRIPLRPADELTDEVLTQIAHALRLRLGERVAVLINNLGATTPMELAIVARRSYAWLDKRGVVVERMYGGTFLSSLDMAGVSVSVMRLDDERLRLLDAHTSAPAWPNVTPTAPGSPSQRTVIAGGEMPSLQGGPPETDAGRKTERAIRAACDSLLDHQEKLTELDRITGDGDLGVNLGRAALRVRAGLTNFPLDDPSAALKALGFMVQEIGGSSGPLYGVLFLRAGASLEGGGNELKAWAAAIVDACNAVSDLGGARLGDRTMLDALIPFAHEFHRCAMSGASAREALEAGASAAERGAERTASIVARRGRSSYLGERVLGHPDPGAIATAIWLREVSSVVGG